MLDHIFSEQQLGVVASWNFQWRQDSQKSLPLTTIKNEQNQYIYV